MPPQKTVLVTEAPVFCLNLFVIYTRKHDYGDLELLAHQRG